MQIETTLTIDHWREYLANCARLAPHAGRKRPLWAWWTAEALLSLITAYLLINLVGQIHWPTAILVSLAVLCAALIIFIQFAKLKKALYPAPDGVVLGVHRYTFDEAGISASGYGYQTSMKWPVILGVVETKNLIILVLDSAYGILLSKRDIMDLSALSGILEKHVNMT